MTEIQRFKSLSGTVLLALAGVCLAAAFWLLMGRGVSARELAAICLLDLAITWRVQGARLRREARE